jgi:hypothetical protein
MQDQVCLANQPPPYVGTGVVACNRTIGVPEQCGSIFCRHAGGAQAARKSVSQIVNNGR